MATGTRKDPYSLYEFNQMADSNHWFGGWVKHGDDLVYHTRYLSTCTNDGSRLHSIPVEFYNEMAELRIWLGGWVSIGSLKYITSNGVQYDGSIGQENYPCSMSIYYEMVSNNMWEGGWIEESDGSKRYVRNFPVGLISGDGCGCGSSGCGCGCGCGSGCGSDGGCGCGGCCGCCGIGSIEPIKICPINSGEDDLAGVISLPGLGISIDVKISWSEGGTSGLYALSAANVELSFNDYRYDFDANNIITRWDSAYTLGIRGNFGVTYLGHHINSYSIDASYTIPSQYYA
jgi:hypothetical protein